jgi:hypothetical protein
MNAILRILSWVTPQDAKAEAMFNFITTTNVECGKFSEGVNSDKSQSCFFTVSTQFRNYLDSIAVLLLICFLPYSSGCSLIAYSGISDKELDSIPSGLTRQELQERFGDPVSSVTAASGRKMEVFRIRRQLPDREKYLAGDIACIPAFGYCLFFGPLTFIEATMKSQAHRIDVAFLYGPDDRTVYHYILSVPEQQYFEAAKSLAHPILDTAVYEKCERPSACVKEYIAELRLRALETGYGLDAEWETRFQQHIEISHEIENHTITREDAIKLLSPQTSQ